MFAQGLFLFALEAFATAQPYDSRVKAAQSVAILVSKTLTQSAIYLTTIASDISIPERKKGLLDCANEARNAAVLADNFQPITIDCDLGESLKASSAPTRLQRISVYLEEYQQLYRDPKFAADVQDFVVTETTIITLELEAHVNTWMNSSRKTAALKSRLMIGFVELLARFQTLILPNFDVTENLKQDPYSGGLVRAFVSAVVQERAALDSLIDSFLNGKPLSVSLKFVHLIRFLDAILKMNRI